MKTTATEAKKFLCMPRWDGKAGGYEYPYGKTDLLRWEMRRDPNSGAVYYLNYENPREINLYCPGSRLAAHLRHLNQIKARYESRGTRRENKS